MNSIGKPIDRLDGPLKVTGKARYAAEFTVPGLVHAVLVQSTIPAGAITGFDLKDAQDMPGVLAIVTPDKALKLGGPNGAQAVHGPLLQDRLVLFNGQHVAVVVADTLDRASAAAARVRVQYRRDEATVSMDSALSEAYPPKHFRNGARPPDSTRGDPDRSFSSGSVKVDATYITPIEHHNPMEPHATIARWQDDRLTVWTATQGISGAQSTLAAMFGIDRGKVRVICPYVGGGFGCKGNTWPPAILAAMASRLVARPVKLVLTRAQMFTSNGYRPRTIQKLKFAADSNGKLVSMRHDGFSMMSQPSLGEFSEPVALATEMLYACPNVAVTHRLVATNSGLPTYMRAPGKASGNFALESAMDELAVALKIDPVEFRLRNYADHDPHENKPFASKALRACYQQGAEAFGWSRRSVEPRSMRDGKVLIGWGMATSTYPTNRRAASARIRVNADGSVVVQSGTQDLGTGTYTVMTQVAADALGVPVSRVRFELGDSALPPAPISGGSSTVPSVSPAVLAACEAVRARIFEMALTDPRVGWSGRNAEGLLLRDGVVISPDRRISVAELLAHRDRPYVEAIVTAEPGEEKQRYSMHAFGAQFAEVRVDEDLGEIRVSRFVGAFDCGRVLNAKTARSQLIGGITYGIGMALLEETHVDGETGRIVNANIAEYLVPVNADVRDIRTIVVENNERVSNPLGAKGIGELPMVGVAAAIANAVYHATGIRVRKVPIRIEDVLT
ncbi:MAG TPA: xanthine dehydrogenase family protein molybdopterin-binding subunit [Steroidobacteraceae bacterium]|nr:xanthine dehydrogenase family protein molybdopterin-binding subunit [Steroidobacteraceae bacterium]